MINNELSVGTTTAINSNAAPTDTQTGSTIMNPGVISYYADIAISTSLVALLAYKTVAIASSVSALTPVLLPTAGFMLISAGTAYLAGEEILPSWSVSVIETATAGTIMLGADSVFRGAAGGLINNYAPGVAATLAAVAGVQTVSAVEVLKSAVTYGALFNSIQQLAGRYVHIGQGLLTDRSLEEIAYSQNQGEFAMPILYNSLVSYPLSTVMKLLANDVVGRPVSGIMSESVKNTFINLPAVIKDTLSGTGDTGNTTTWGDFIHTHASNACVGAMSNVLYGLFDTPTYLTVMAIEGNEEVFRQQKIFSRINEKIEEGAAPIIEKTYEYAENIWDNSLQTAQDLWQYIANYTMAHDEL